MTRANLRDQAQAEPGTRLQSDDAAHALFDLPFVGMARIAPRTLEWHQFNGEFGRIAGYEPDELARLQWLDLLHPEDRPAERAEIARIVSGDSAGYRAHRRWIRAEGTIVQVEIDVRARRRGDGEVDHLLAVVREVPGQGKALAALEQSRDLYAALSEINRAATLATGAEQLLREACQIAVRGGRFPFVAADVIDESGGIQRVATAVAGPSGAQVPGDASMIERFDSRSPCREALRTGGLFVANEIVDDTLSQTWAGRVRSQGLHSVAAQPLFSAGRVVGVLTLFAERPGFFDLATQRLIGEIGDSLSLALESLRARAEASEANARLAAIIDASPLPIWLRDLEGRCLLANQAFADMHGIPLAACIGQTRAELLPLDVAEASSAADQTVLLSGQPSTVERRFAVRGRERVLLSNRFPLRDAQGRVYAVGAVATDITEQLRAADELREALERWSSLIETSPAAIFDFDLDGRVVSLWNRAAEEMFGVPASAAIGRPVPVLETAATVDDSVIARIRAHGRLRGVDCARTRLDGKGLHLNVSTAPIRGADGDAPRHLAIIVDVSDRIAAERALAVSERVYHLLFDRNPSPMLVFDIATLRILAVNEAAVVGYGYSRGEFLGLRIDDLRPPEEVERLHAFLRQAGLDKPHHGVWRHRRKDGSTFQAEIHAHSVDLEGVPARLVMATDISEKLQAQQALAESEANLRRLNEELEERIRHRTAELQTAKDRAEAADRLKTMMLATVSHELRTPLNSIIGFSELLLQGLAGPVGVEQARQLGMINAAGRHLLSLICDFLDISKMEAGVLALQPVIFDVCELVESEATHYRVAAREHGLVFELVPPGAACEVFADPRRVKQILDNLVSNAVKFTDRGSVRVAVESLGRSCSISVTDTGIGIPGDRLEGVFEPFARVEVPSRRPREGTGLGLAIARRLAEAMDGRISVESEVGRGSTFRLTLGRSLGDVGRGMGSCES